MFSLATCLAEILLMAEILHLLIGSSSHYLQDSINPRWCRISASNSSAKFYQPQCLGLFQVPFDQQKVLKVL